MPLDLHGQNFRQAQGPPQQLRQLRLELTDVGGRGTENFGQGSAVTVGQGGSDQLISLGLDLGDQLGQDHEGVPREPLGAKPSVTASTGQIYVA
ncbi:hypothetical protein ACFXDH_38125 [Streptomyces sp. NPDC059467]|uniref:hypothetical protein n=1 Tax=Streptomyces sp. NPDC059467 TaxID=3346844 RepID=UPI003692EBEF